MKKRALFLDRDGVINIDYGYVHKQENFHFIDGIFELVTEANRLDFLVIVVTNQAGIGRGYYTETDFHTLTSWMKDQFILRGARIDDVYFCPEHPIYGVGHYLRDSGRRKPNPGMILEAALDHNIELSKSVMVGDKFSDMQAAEKSGLLYRLHFSTNINPSTSIYKPIASLLEVIKVLNLVPQ